MPVIGITASSNQFIKLTNYFSIASTVVTSAGGAASIAFTSIPSTYTHLQLRGIVRSLFAGAEAQAQVILNSDNGTNYSFHAIRGNGSTASAENLVSSNNAVQGQWVANTATANVFSGVVIDILDYANTNKFKTIRTLHGNDNNGSGSVFFSSSNWRNTNAITSISIGMGGAANLAQNSSFALYGVL